MTLERDRVARFFVMFDAELARLVGVCRGEQLIAATRARATIGELVRTCGYPALLHLVRALQATPGKPRGKPFTRQLEDVDIDRAMRESGRNATEAAATLGCARSTIYERAKKSDAIASDKLQPLAALMLDRRR